MSTGTSPGLSPGEQARLRREKREKRILSQGNSRLERIAGLQGGAAAREALHPDPPEADISELSDKKSYTSGSQVSRQQEEPFSLPRRDIFGVDGGDDDPFNMLRGGNDPMSNVPDEFKNDPMMRLLLKNPLFNQGMQGAARGAPERDSSAEDLTALAEKITQQLRGAMAGGTETETQEEPGPDRAAWKWKLLRMVGIFTILGYLWNQLEDFHFSRNVDNSYGLVCQCEDLLIN